MTQILIVEDNLEYAEEMADFLAELGHVVHTTNNAQEMWSALSQGTVGVVVLDLGLPDEDGFNVIPRMRQLYPQIGLLVLTGRVAFDGESVHAIAFQIFDADPAPVTDLPRSIWNAIKRAVAKSREERLQTIAEFRDAFVTACRASLPPPVAAAKSPSPKHRKREVM